MIIEYLMRNRAGDNTVMCGEFRDWAHFERFKNVEAYAGRIVLWSKCLKNA